jgi:tyrosyl-tRNA synthetase
MFRSKQAPEVIEERTLSTGSWKLSRLLVELELAPSMGEARRLIQQGGVYVDGERSGEQDLNLTPERTFLLQVGKRRFVRVSGEKH